MIDKDLIIRLQQQQIEAQNKLIAELRTMIKLLEARIEKVEIAKHTDANVTSLSKDQLKYWYKKYDDLMTEGLRLHPLPEMELRFRPSCMLNRQYYKHQVFFTNATNGQ